MCGSKGSQSTPHRLFCPSLQLCVEDGLKLNQISRALGAARKLVGHFNHSVVSTQALLQKQAKDAGSKPLKLVQDVSTRWNSSYTMAQRLLLLRVPVFAVLYDESVTIASERSVLDMTDANWKVLEAILPVLEPFMQATEILAKEDTPTGSQVLVLINSLYSTLDDDESDTVICRDLKTKIKQGMIERFSLDHDGLPNDEAFESSMIVLALALDPRYKSLKFLTSFKRQIVKARIKSLLEKETQNMEKPNAIVKTEGDDLPKKRQKVTDCLVRDIVLDLTNEEMEFDEYSEYMREIVRVRDPLAWWKVSESRYPHLDSLAGNIYPFPQLQFLVNEFFSCGVNYTKVKGITRQGNCE